jgi:hypothetical protein
MRSAASLCKFEVEASAERARISNMTMLIQTGKIPPRSIAHRNVGVTVPANTPSAGIRQFGPCALAAIVSGLIAAAIIALQTAFYLHSLHD